MLGDGKSEETGGGQGREEAEEGKGSDEGAPTILCTAFRDRLSHVRADEKTRRVKNIRTILLSIGRRTLGVEVANLDTQ